MFFFFIRSFVYFMQSFILGTYLMRVLTMSHETFNIVNLLQKKKKYSVNEISIEVIL